MRIAEYLIRRFLFFDITLWSLQKAEEKVKILKEFGVPVWVMEPLRGGRLAKLTEEEQNIFDEKNPGKSPVDLSFSWVLSIPEVTVILSGMSGFDQLQQNLSFFDINHEITNEESSSLFTLAEQMKNAVPCTACRYCCEGCPMGLNIPLLFSMYNDARFTPKGALSVSMQLDALGEEGGPTACLGCGACAAACPQSIDIPSVMSAFSKLIPQMPNWGNICAKRAEAERKLREGK